MNTSTQISETGSDKPAANHTMNPVTTITNLLAQNGHPSPQGWYEYLNQDALKDETPNPVKRFLVNRAWRTILGTLPEGAPRERFSLIDEGDENVWLKLFTEEVLPAALLYKLPAPYGSVIERIDPSQQQLS